MKLSDIARFSALVAGSLIAAAPGAVAQEGVFMKDFLGSIGIIPKEKAPIEYRERAPLVLPPRIALRGPVAPRPLQTANPQWPNDPDVVAARRRDEEANIPVTMSE